MALTHGSTSSLSQLTGQLHSRVDHVAAYRNPNLAQLSSEIRLKYADVLRAAKNLDARLCREAITAALEVIRDIRLPLGQIYRELPAIKDRALRAAQLASAASASCGKVASRVALLTAEVRRREAVPESAACQARHILQSL